MRLFCALLLILLTACAPRANLDLVANPLDVGWNYNVFIGTTRAKIDNTYDKFRRGDLSFARYLISVPPTHAPGELELPKRNVPDPLSDFVATQQEKFSSTHDFRQKIGAALRTNGTRAEAIVYVHGFNNTMGDAVFRITQLTHDLKLTGTPVSYSWPSAGNPLGYAYDRDSALFARDGMEGLLAELEAAGAREIVLVAHSMGALLTMETLRQLAIANNTSVLSKIKGVILMSADIDVEVFHQQAVRIGNLPQPFVLFTSSRDKALRLSARLSGEKERLGNLTDVSLVADLEVTVVDVSQFEGASMSQHFVAGSSASLLRILGQLRLVEDAFRQDVPGRAGLLPGTVLTVQNATQVILSPVAALAGAAQ